MRRFLLLALSTTAALVAAVAVFIFSTLPARVVRPGTAPDRGSVIWGAYHVHSNRSDGSGTVDEIAAAASRAGLSFVVLTDHGDATRQIEPPRYLNGVLCIDAVELNTDNGHVVALNLAQTSAYPLAGEARDVIEDIHRLGGLAVIAHPDSPRGGLGWRGPTTLADGIEWLNVDSEWRGRTNTAVAAAALRAIVRGPESIASLFERPRRSLARWDEMQRRRAAFSIAATDAHARLGGEQGSRGLGALKFPSYEALFRTIVQAIPLGAPLTQDATADAREILLALGAGQSYSVVRAFADVLPAIEFTAATPVGRVSIGRHLPAGIDASFRASTPSMPAARLDLVRDGAVIESRIGLVELATRTPGAYRVEAYLPGHDVPWVVTNAVQIDRERPAPLPRPASAPKTSRPTSGVPLTVFAIEADSSSTGALQPDGSGTTLSYRLGGGPAAGQFVAMAASSGETPIDRIEFVAQSGEPMRISLQVRVPGGRDGQRWRRSIYVDRTARKHSIPLSELEPVERGSMLRPVIARIQSVLVVIDTVNTLPGKSGQLTISDVVLVPGTAGGG